MCKPLQSAATTNVNELPHAVVHDTELKRFSTSFEPVTNQLYFENVIIKMQVLRTELKRFQTYFGSNSNQFYFAKCNCCNAVDCTRDYL